MIDGRLRIITLEEDNDGWNTENGGKADDGGSLIINGMAEERDRYMECCI